MPTYHFSQDPARMQLDVIHGYLQRSYWCPNIRRDVVETALHNSMVIGAFEAESGQQVAYARLITDRATFAYLCDVFVLEEHRGHKLSQQMLEQLFVHPELQTLRRWCLATWNAQPLYAKLGFEPVPADRWMHLKPPEERWQ
ncbi:MAG: GNAT family N-acetyltransferase [Planctomycetes bacterium]|nr:GNAT family N-acetyltransferase [Planctomycetota bacterium]MCB9909718.1 GNAT family N-acetyltransferase [Planctomycetota bacterium]MCB9911792.1 GNAT family N-acetyltransferase [Planctomycetota bacterium]